MEGKYTKGPWKLGMTGNSGVLANPPKDWKPTPEHPQYIVCQPSLYVSTPREEQKANARLIAAAPELLACLKNIELIASVNGPAILDGSRMHKEIQAVIAKAEK